MAPLGPSCVIPTEDGNENHLQPTVGHHFRLKKMLSCLIGNSCRVYLREQRLRSSAGHVTDLAGDDAPSRVAGWPHLEITQFIMIQCIAVSQSLHYLGTLQSAHLYDDEDRGALLAAAVRGHHGEDVRVTRGVVEGLRAAQDACSQN